MQANQPPVLHVTFGASAAGLLKQVVAELGRTDRVTYLDDDLGVGPIKPTDPHLRSAWMAEELGWVYGLGEGPGCAADSVVRTSIETFWSEVTTTDSSLIVWLSRRCVCEYTGFLELQWRRTDTSNLRFVDVSNFEFNRAVGCVDSAQQLAWVPPTEIIARRMIDRAEPIDSTALDEARMVWQRLKTENAALRILGPTGLVSAPITHFDDVITSYTSREWRDCGPVINGSCDTCSSGPFEQTSFKFLWQRMLKLISDGVLEGRGDFASVAAISECSVRRPT